MDNGKTTMTDNRVYNVPANLTELPAPSQTIGIKYLQVQPRANSTGDAFPNSSINFFWTMSGNQRWIPSRSYVRIRNSMFMNLGNLARQPQEEKSGAPLMGPTYLQAAGLFDGAQIRVGGYTVSNVQQHHGQIAACEDRISKSGAFFDTLPPSINYGDVDFTTRRAKISLQGIREAQYSSGGTDASWQQVTGTASVTGPGLVTGVGTAFNTAGEGKVDVGDQIYIVSSAGGNPVSYMVVTAVTSDTELQCTPTTPIIVGDEGDIFKFDPDPTFAAIPTEQANLSETCFQPSLSLFKQDKALQGSWELVLNPKSSSQFRTSAMQSTNPILPPNGTGMRMNQTVVTNGADMTGLECAFDVTDIQFFVAVVESANPNPSKESIALELQETNVQPRRITGGQTVESYNVERSLFATSWGIQSSDAGRNTLYPCTQFTAGAAVDGAGAALTTFNKDQDTLQQYLVTYAGQTRENPALNVQITPGDGATTNGVDYTTWQYLISQLAHEKHRERGGVITKAQNRELGNLNTVKWRKPAGNVSTDLQLNVTYGDGPFPPAGADTRHNLLLFSHFRSIVQIDFVDGLVVGYSKQSA